ALALAARTAPLSLERANLLNARGSLAINRSQLDAAEESLREALHIYEQLGAPPLSRTPTLINLDVLEFYRRELDKAEAYCQQALDIFAREDPMSINHSFALHNSGDLADARGEPERPEALYQQALRI